MRIDQSRPFRTLLWPLILGLGLGLGLSPGWARADSTRDSAIASAGPPIIASAAWRNPPREFRPIARWWGPGGSVQTQGLQLHLDAIARAGFGSVEVQPLLLGLGPGDLRADPRLRSVGEADFFERLAEAAKAAQKNDLRFDLTLGSGWPGGGQPPIGMSDSMDQIHGFDPGVLGGEGGQCKAS